MVYLGSEDGVVANTGGARRAGADDVAHCVGPFRDGEAAYLGSEDGESVDFDDKDCGVANLWGARGAGTDGVESLLRIVSSQPLH